MFVVLAHPFMKAFLIALSCFTYFQAAAQSYFVFAEPAKRELAQKPFQKVLVLDKRKDTGAVAKLKFAAEKDTNYWVQRSLSQLSLATIARRH